MWRVTFKSTESFCIELGDIKLKLLRCAILLTDTGLMSSFIFGRDSVGAMLCDSQNGT